MSYTIYDIAKQAGVSIATVSRVFNNSTKVSKTTRQKVLSIAEKVGYHPHGFARGLASHKNKIIMAVVPLLSNYFFMQVLAGIQDKITEYDYELYIYNIKPNEDKLTQIKQLLRRKWASGYLFVSIHLRDEEWKHFFEFEELITLVDDTDPGLDSIYVDNIEGAKKATDHLLDMGFKNPAMILPTRNSKPALDREKGFMQILENRGVQINPGNIVTGDTLYRDGYNEQNGYEAMKKLLALSTRPDACFCASDIQAVGALGAIREERVQLPLIGYDDIKIAEFLGLTTIRQPMYEMGSLAVDHILKKTAGHESKRLQRVFPTELVLRASTASELMSNE